MNPMPQDFIPTVTDAPSAVVGIGASAGGLEACSELLKHLDVPTTMAFIVVQHLDPDRASHLVELLGKVSPLPVSLAGDGQRVQADQVYVIAPDTCLALRDGVLYTQPRPPGHFKPVDSFLCSLAADQGRRAIAVILSGTGADGSRGVGEVRQHGGICFAQDESAKFAGMPASAIATGCVDFVRSPGAIAQVLATLTPERGGAPVLTALSSADEELLGQLFLRLKRVTSVAYGQYKRSTIVRRMQRRLALLGLNGLAAYVAYIDQHPHELELLHQDLLIHVTRFFRDPAVFDALLATAIPALLARRGVDDVLRLWVPGCATGEEVYSLAICLQEALAGTPAGVPVKIFATDVSEAALATARAGRYPLSIAADVSAARLRDYFEETKDGYRISKTIRDQCVFARHDMTSDPPFANLDLISCRNVFIYLGPELQRQVLPIFHYALKERGLLLLGSAETIGSLSELFVAVDARQRIYERVPGARLPLLSFSPGRTLGGINAANLNLVGPRTTSANFRQQADRALVSHCGPPGVLISAELEILQSRGDVAPFLTLAAGTASLNILKMARGGLMLELRAAIAACRQSGRPVRQPGIRIDAQTSVVDLQVLPVGDSTQRCYWVLFEPVDMSLVQAARGPQSAAEPELPAYASDAAHEIALLREELSVTRTHLQSLIEQLESGNEELSVTYEEVLSSNEELQSTNEELHTAKEELQASNEELSTINDELQQRIREATLLNNDLANLFRNVALAVVIVGPHLEVRRFTPAAGELFNLIVADVGRPITTIKSQLVGDELERRLNLTISTSQDTQAEVCDTRGASYQLSIRPYLTHDNRIDGAVVTLTNIDAIKQAQAAIRAARDAAEDIIVTIDVPLVVLDDEQRAVSANQAFHNCFGTSPASVANRVPDPQHGFSWYTGNVAQLLQWTLETGEPLTGHEVQTTVVGGGSRTFLLGARCLPRRAGLGAQLLVRIEEISEQRQLQGQLRQAQKMESVGHLAAGIAHDFNNQLTIILGYANMLKTRLKGDAKSTEMLGEIAAAGTKSESITRQLLAFSRKSMLTPDIVDLGRQLDKMTSMLPRLVGEHIRLEVDCAPDVGLIFIDQSLLAQALLNLAINARDAMPAGGALRIEAANCEVSGVGEAGHAGMPAGSYVVLRIMDSGAGMDAETLEHIFEPFFTTKAVGKGTGLGLASVHGSVMQSSGFIYVDSQPGQGTTFSIYLPRVTGGPSVPASDNSAAQSAPPRGHEVLLLVEDEPRVRQLAYEVLDSAGYVVLEAQDGIAALALSRAHTRPIDLLVTDIVMPHMGGLELAQILQAERPGLGVLFVSGFNDDALARSGIDLAAVALLVKPYSPITLAYRVRALLDLRKPPQGSPAS